MKKRKRVLQVLITSVCMIALCIGAIGSVNKVVEIEDEPVALEDSIGTLISETAEDINVIPDKYNCGAKGELTEVTAGQTINSVKFKLSSGKNVMEFGYGNKHISGTVTFENMDFSNNDMGFYNEYLVDRDIKVVFNNCKFAQIKTSQVASRMQYEFNNCTLISFYGCNATFNRCLFGQHYRDGIIPFQNVTVNDSYIKDMASTDPASAGIHSDGTQMYGHKDAEVKDVYFNNCRFEVPAVQTGSNSASVNACIMVQLEYNNGKNINFKNCKINGGGYSIYARTTTDKYTLSNVVFENIDVGGAKLFKTVYSKVSDGVEFINVKDTASLYVGSVWQEDGTTHFSVSNDTNIARKITIYTDSNIYNFAIPACPDGKNLYDDFADYPFDIDISIPEKCTYAVCYDSTEENNEKQLRFVNWTNQEVRLKISNKQEASGNVVIEDKVEESVVEKQEAVAVRGTCGRNVEYTLDADGILHIRGTGATDNFHSKKNAPWYDYKDKIVKVVIDDGITKIGNQCFRDCNNINQVEIPDSVSVIGANAFIRCYGLNEIRLPENLKEVGSYAFAGTRLKKSSYAGNEQEWSSIVVGIRNESLLTSLVYE